MPQENIGMMMKSTTKNNEVKMDSTEYTPYTIQVTIDEEWLKEDTGINDIKKAIERILEPLGHSGIFYENCTKN